MVGLLLVASCAQHRTVADDDPNGLLRGEAERDAGTAGRRATEPVHDREQGRDERAPSATVQPPRRDAGAGASAAGGASNVDASSATDASADDAAAPPKPQGYRDPTELIEDGIEPLVECPAQPTCTMLNWQDFAPDLRCCFLVEADLRAIDMSGFDLRGADLRRAILPGAIMYEVLLADTDFRGATMTPLAAVLHPAAMTRTKLYGMSGCPDYHPEALIASGGDPPFVCVNHPPTGFSALIMAGSDLHGVDLTGVDLSPARLDGVVSYGLLGCPGTWPAGAWRCLEHGAGQHALIGPRVSLAEADLSGVDLSGADLQSADLRRANLRGADLGGASLAGADLRNARLAGANLSGTVTTRATLCPDGSAGPCF